MGGAVWGPQVDELRVDHRCCHYDHLGVGESDPGPLLRTIPAMADDAVRIMDDLHWDRSHVVGVSMGGMIAQEIALRSADRCRSLTLIATHDGAPIASLPTLKGMGLFLKGLFGGRKVRLKFTSTLALSPGVPRFGRCRNDARASARPLGSASRASNHPRTALRGFAPLYEVASLADRSTHASGPPRQRYLDSPHPDRPARRAHSQFPRAAFRRRRTRRHLSKSSRAQRGFASALRAA